MSYENIWESHGVYRRYSNTVTGDEIRRAVEDVQRHQRFDSVRYVINDFLDVIEQNITPRQIEIIAAIDNAAWLTNPHVKVAVVTTMKTIQEMASLYARLTEGTSFQCEMFTFLDEAREWVAK